jgi:hypothetical protein
MNRLLRAVAPVLLLALSAGAQASPESQPCAGPPLAALARQMQVDHFAPGPNAFGADPAGVILSSACKRMPDDPRLTLVAVAWDAGKTDSKSLVLAIVDESAGSVVTSMRDEIYEDAITQVHNGSLRLDTAAYVLAPGVRAFGLDLSSDNPGCGDDGYGPQRSLYVRDGASLRPVVAGLQLSQYRYVRGNQPRCVSDQKEAETAIVENFKVTIELGASGKGGWRTLVMTATSSRSDHRPGRKPLHVSVPYDGDAYPLVTFVKAYDQWRK